MKEWGDGVSNAKTVEDAERIWKAVKEKEKAEMFSARHKRGDPKEKDSFEIVPVKALFGCFFMKGNSVWSYIKCHGKVLVGAAFGYFFSHFWRGVHYR
jgi:hypothetical protein